MKIINPLASLAMIICMCGYVYDTRAEVINVPTDFQTISLAVQNADEGDTIILAPGTYDEKNIEINIPLKVSSQWIITENETYIDKTIVNASNSILFSVTSDDVEISGLKIINGDQTLDIDARATVKYNYFYNNIDPVSMKAGGGGYVGYNLFENNGDDGIDLDISNGGSDILIEHNTIDDSNDDGIEISLFTSPNQQIHFEIRYNTITRSNGAGIQLISSDVFTGKVFDIHHNIIKTCKAAIGCMGGSNTTEDLSGASMMDETVYLYNNTFLESEVGATGGNTMIAINNVISDNSIGGFKRFGEFSVIANNLFFNNNDSDLIEIDVLAEQSDNISNSDPLLNEITHKPGMNSPCIDAGLSIFSLDGIPVIEINTEMYEGSAPDIGAVESSSAPTSASINSFSDNHRIRNYPNPFLLTTNISLYISTASYVKADIYDLTGRHIHALDEGMRDQGMHTFEWSAKDENGNRLPGGLYIAKVGTGNAVSNIKMLLLD